MSRRLRKKEDEKHAVELEHARAESDALRQRTGTRLHKRGSLKSIQPTLSNPFNSKSMTSKNASNMMRKPSALLILVVFTLIVQLLAGCKSKVKVATE